MKSQVQPTTTAPQTNLIKVIVQGFFTFLIGAIVIVVLLCLIAGTFRYWQAWIFAILFNFGTASQGIYLYIKDPALLERRKQVAPASESMGERLFIIFGLICVFGLIIFCAIDHRFSLSHMPILVMIVGDIFIVLSYLIYYFVFMENSFAASSIRTFEGQKVISTGPYAIIRHPKYIGDVFLVAGISLSLGSWWGIIILAITILGLTIRIIDEEKLLLKDLLGYKEYMEKVRYRLFLYLW
jgi:protein-S-isoprenylcysteine O-methyltransferase Ste14